MSVNGLSLECHIPRYTYNGRGRTNRPTKTDAKIPTGRCEPEKHLTEASCDSRYSEALPSAELMKRQLSNSKEVVPILK